MKKIVLFLVMGVIVFSLARSHSKAFNIQFNNSMAQSISHPFVVEVVETDGSISKEYRGVSGNSDQFKISEDLGAGPFPEDRYKAFPDIKMGIGSKITLYRAPVIKIKDGKRSKTVRSWTKTVGDLFAEQKIEIGKDDKVNFTDDTATENNMEIAITRVAITTVMETEAIEYKTVKKPNANVEKGNTRTLQAGKDGVKNKYFLVRREDGDEVSRSLTKTEVATAPTDEIIEYGTKVVVYGSGVASIWKADSGLVAACNFVGRGTKAHVVNTDNGKSVDITCMGGGLQSDRMIDLSDTAFIKLGGSWSQGLLKNVRVEKYYPE